MKLTSLKRGETTKEASWFPFQFFASAVLPVAHPSSMVLCVSFFFFFLALAVRDFAVASSTEKVAGRRMAKSQGDSDGSMCSLPWALLAHLVER